MPGLRKMQLRQRVEAELTKSQVRVLGSSFVGNEADLPWRCLIEFAPGFLRPYSIYFWTVSHGGKSRSFDEYRIQTKLKSARRLLVETGTTLLLGYYHESLDRSGRSVGKDPPPGMEIFAAWDPLLHLHLGESSSCQIPFPVMYEAYLKGRSQFVRRLSADAEERIFAFRPEFLSSYLRAASGGHVYARVDDLEPAYVA